LLTYVVLVIGFFVIMVYNSGYTDIMYCLWDYFDACVLVYNN